MLKEILWAVPELYWVVIGIPGILTLLAIFDRLVERMYK